MDFLPVAYLSIKDEPWRCRQLVLSFIGTFLSTEVASELTFLEAEAVRYSRRLLRPFTPVELACHLRITDRHARRLLHHLVEREFWLCKVGTSGIARIAYGLSRPYSEKNSPFEILTDANAAIRVNSVGISLFLSNNDSGVR